MTNACVEDIAADPGEWNGLFARIGSELLSLAGVVGDLQRYLTPLVVAVVQRDPDAIKRLQDLDIVEQSLAGLSELVSRFDASVRVTDPGALASQVKAMRLTGLALRLSAREADERDRQPESSTLELF